MLAQPRGHVRVALVAVFIENHDHRAHLAVEFLEISDVNAAIMPVADGLADIDAIQQ